MGNYPPTHTPAVGQRFGQLVILETNRRFPPTGKHAARGMPGDRACLVRCDCGTTWLVRTAQLHNPTWPTHMCIECRRGLRRKAVA